MLVPGVELLRVAGEGFGARAEREVSQAAFFEFGKFAADIIRRTGDDARSRRTRRRAQCGPWRRPALLIDERAKGFGQLDDAPLGVERVGFVAPANRSRHDAVARLSLLALRTTRARWSMERHTSIIAHRPSDGLRLSPVRRRSVRCRRSAVRWLDMYVFP